MKAIEEIDSGKRENEGREGRTWYRRKLMIAAMMANPVR